jgi:hypothetical protein
MARTEAQIQAELTANAEAMARARVAQSYTLPGGTTVQRPAITALMSDRAKLEAELAQAQSGGAAFRRVGFGGAT